MQKQNMFTQHIYIYDCAFVSRRLERSIKITLSLHENDARHVPIVRNLVVECRLCVQEGGVRVANFTDRQAVQYIANDVILK
jgi:hypothetical protein